MLKVYCSSCGSPLYYESIKPKFCSGCGFQLDGKKIEAKKQIIVSSDDDDNDDENRISNFDITQIKSLDVQIETNKSQDVDLGSVIGTNPGDTSWKNIKRDSPFKGKRKKQFAQDFHKIAGGVSAKGNSIEIGGNK